MLVIADTLPMPSLNELTAPRRQTSGLRHAHWPPELAAPPEEWAGAWSGFVETYSIRWRPLDEAYAALRLLVARLRGGERCWDPDSWS